MTRLGLVLDPHDIQLYLGVGRVLMYALALQVAVRLASTPAAFVAMILMLNASITATGGNRVATTIVSMFSTPVLCLVLIRFAKYDANERDYRRRIQRDVNKP